MTGLTPFQTVGPFLHLGLRIGCHAMTAPGVTATLRIQGRLLDGAGDGIPDGVLEFWASGYESIGRVWTDASGAYRLEAARPRARIDAEDALHAPHFAVRVLARGILTEYLTRVYFDDEDNARDLILQLVPPERRRTLVAVANRPAEYHHDIVVQGERETVFFDL